MKRAWICHLSLTVVALVPLFCAADVYVVAHASQSARTLTSREVVDVFMGRSRSFGNVTMAQPLDLPREHPARAAFYRQLTGMSPAQVGSYWARLNFTGQKTPPILMTSEAAVLSAIKANAAAIGYLGFEPTDPAVRVMLVLRDEP